MGALKINRSDCQSHYDPELGRFISQDPLGVYSQDLNFFRYVGNNPSINKDPTGLKSYYVSRQISGPFPSGLFSHNFVVVVPDNGASIRVFSFGPTGNTTPLDRLGPDSTFESIDLDYFNSGNVTSRAINASDSSVIEAGNQISNSLQNNFVPYKNDYLNLDFINSNTAARAVVIGAEGRVDGLIPSATIGGAPGSDNVLAIPGGACFGN